MNLEQSRSTYSQYPPACTERFIIHLDRPQKDRAEIQVPGDEG